MRKMIQLFLFSTMTLGTSLLTAQTFNPSQSTVQSTPAGQINWLNSYSDAVSSSQSTSKPIVILFTGTSWCPACMKLERDVIANPEFIRAVGDKFVFLKAEFPDYSERAIKASPFKPLMDQYGVNQYPTMVVINANGQKLATVNYRNGAARSYADELLQVRGQ